MHFKRSTLMASALAFAAMAGMAVAQDVAREKTVIFDLDRTIQDPENFNWFTPGTKREHGAHQTMWEPLFILNDGSGDLDPWLATGFMDLPAPERVIFLESGGEESRAQLIASNQLDAAQKVAVGTFEAIAAQNPNVIAWYDDYPFASADPCARQLEINTTIAPWDTPRS